MIASNKREWTAALRDSLGLATHGLTYFLSSQVSWNLRQHWEILGMFLKTQHTGEVAVGFLPAGLLPGVYVLAAAMYTHRHAVTLMASSGKLPETIKCVYYTSTYNKTKQTTATLPLYTFSHAPKFLSLNIFIILVWSNRAGHHVKNQHSNLMWALAFKETYSAWLTFFSSLGKRYLSCIHTYPNIDTVL